MNDLAIIGLSLNGIYLYEKLKKTISKVITIEKEANACDCLIKKYDNQTWDSFLSKKFPVSSSKDIGIFYQKWFNSQDKIKNHIHLFNSEVKNIISHNNHVELRLNDNKNVFAKKVVICTGWHDNPKKLNIKSDYKYIKYSSTNETIKQQKIVLIGASYGGIEFIKDYLPHNNIVWLIRDKHRWESEVGKLKYSRRPHVAEKQSQFYHILNEFKDNLKIIRSEVKHFYENNSLQLYNGDVINDIDRCEIRIGYNMDNELFHNSNIELNDKYFIKTNQHSKTSLKNVFVFGAAASQHNDFIYIRDQESQFSLIKGFLE